MKQHSPLTKYLLYHTLDATFSLRKINTQENMEYLHRFRVSLRLVRSLLQLYAKERIIFPPILKSFLKATNLLRDLDVLILSLHQKSSQKVLKQLISLRNERYKALFTQESKIRILQSLDEFYDLLNNFNLTFTNDYLIQTTYDHHHESVRHYLTLSPSASKKELHRLRIRFKLSRYGFDFLVDSRLEDSYEEVEASKEVQDKLGKVHDLYNQIKLLKTLEKQEPSKELIKLIVKRTKILKKLQSPLNLFNTMLS